MGFGKDTIEGIEKALNSENDKLNLIANTTADTLITALLPFAIINEGRKRAVDYFKNKFAQDYQAKIEHIPAENLQEPKHNIAYSAMNGISNVIDQPSLHEAYLNTLAKSSDSREDDSLFPAYLDIIQQLGSEGLALFTKFVEKYKNKRSVEFYPPIYFSKEGYINLGSGMNYDLLKITKKSMLENWQRLGLITISNVMKNETYQLRDSFGQPITKATVELKVERFIFEIRLTSFGEDFLETVSEPT